MKSVSRGMRVRINGDPEPWVVLERHPEPLHWWLHRWRDGQWETTFELYTRLNQVFR